MSQADFEKVKGRLEGVKQGILWALAVLVDPATELVKYELTEDEVEELFQEFHADLAEIQTALTQVLLRRAKVRVENKEMKIVGPVSPRWRSQLQPELEQVFDIPPFEDPENSPN